MSYAELADKVIEACVVRGRTLALAESCTGGLVAGALTDIPGASAVIDRGFVTYSNEAKQEVLGVPPALIERHGAVSREVAEAMAQGTLEHSRADLTLSVTGIAGPGGGSAEKPVGLVWFGIGAKGAPPESFSELFDGDRQEIRAAAVRAGLEALARKLGQGPAAGTAG